MVSGVRVDRTMTGRCMAMPSSARTSPLSASQAPNWEASAVSTRTKRPQRRKSGDSLAAIEHGQLADLRKRAKQISPVRATCASVEVDDSENIVRLRRSDFGGRGNGQGLSLMLDNRSGRPKAELLVERHAITRCDQPQRARSRQCYDGLHELATQPMPAGGFIDDDHVDRCDIPLVGRHQHRSDHGRGVGLDRDESRAQVERQLPVLEAVRPVGLARKAQRTFEMFGAEGGERDGALCH